MVSSKSSCRAEPDCYRREFTMDVRESACSEAFVPLMRAYLAFPLGRSELLSIDNAADFELRFLHLLKTLEPFP